MSGNVPAPGEEDSYKIVRAIRDLFEGRSNAVGSVTLDAGATSTTVPAMNCGSGATPILTPMTANAAAEIANGTLYIGTVANGSFIIMHANNGQTDRTFRYAAFG